MYRQSNWENLQSPPFSPVAGQGPPQPPPPPVPEPPRVDQVGYEVLTSEHISTDEDPYAFLGHFHTIFLIDDSVSMSKYWGEAEKLFQELAPFFSPHYPNGLKMHFVNHGAYLLMNWRSHNRGNNASDIFQSAKPNSRCRLGRRLKYLLKGYIKEYVRCLKGGRTQGSIPIWPVNVVVVTAGEIDDDIVQPLMWTSIALDLLRAPLYQVGVQFFHVKNQKVGALNGLSEMASKFNFRKIVSTAWLGPPGEWSANEFLDRLRDSVEASIGDEEDRANESEDDTGYGEYEVYDSEYDDEENYFSEITKGMQSL
ncbi:hypothetical protein F5Y06DRAFT_108816 [Hypoxylon sp. FL0890]|nr:hypothetical protein F5Y06DRAFT_108816 [Hypoxylon sp. FL0890]